MTLSYRTYRLEPIYEAQFGDSSYGYRPGRSPHRCLDDRGKTLQQKRVNHVVEADIKSFFDKVNRDWRITFLHHRIGDPRGIRLIEPMFWIMEEVSLTRQPFFEFRL